jgi:hypothetical protein
MASAPSIGNPSMTQLWMNTTMFSIRFPSDKALSPLLFPPHYKYPQFMMRVVAQVENDDKEFWK